MSKDKIETYIHPEDGTNVKKTWSCKALIFQKKWSVTHILLVQNEHDGHWSLPGGSVQEWEDENITLNRECREELWTDNFEITQYSKFSTTEKLFLSPIDHKWRHKVYMWYLCSCHESSDLGKWKFTPRLEALWKVKDFEEEILQSFQD
jgi:8-oxo-dGTP pyrophosphatase MutT (NUDIX family)